MCITHTHTCKYTHMCAEKKGRQREIERGETKDKRFGEGGVGEKDERKRRKRKHGEGRGRKVRGGE